MLGVFRSPLSKIIFLIILQVLKAHGFKDEEFAEITTSYVTLSGSYESLLDLSPFFPETRFKAPQGNCYGESEEEKLCLEYLKPGLTHFSAGAIPSFFPLSKQESEEESSRCFQKLFNWGNCSHYKTLKSSRGSVIPMTPVQNLTQMDTHSNGTITRITPFNLKMLVTSGVNWASFPDVYDLPYFEYKKGSEALHVNMELTMLKLDVSPQENEVDEGVKQDYESLPEQFNVEKYFRFVSKYGTHLKSGGTIGARWTALYDPVPYDLFDTLKNWNSDGTKDLNTVAELVIGASLDLDHIFLTVNLNQWVTRCQYRIQGGEFKENFKKMDKSEHYNAWFYNAIANPRIIYANYTPLNDFMDSPSSERYHSFKEMIKCEEAHNNLRKIIFQFGSVVTSELNPLAKYLIKEIGKQADLICPSEGLQDLIEKGITAEMNIDLEKLTLELIKEPQFNYKNQTMQRKGYKLPLIPGICFNFSVKLRNINEVSMEFPKNVNCYSVYKSKGCKGEKIDVFNEGEMKNVIGLAGSISFCPVCSKKQSLF